MIFFKSGVDIGIELHEYSYCVLSAPPPPTPLNVINHNHLSNCFTRAKKRLPREISMPTYLHSSLFLLSNKHQFTTTARKLVFLTTNCLTKEHGLRTPREEIAFTAWPKIQSQSQISRYGRSIFRLPYRPNFSDIFDGCP